MEEQAGALHTRQSSSSSAAAWRRAVQPPAATVPRGQGAVQAAGDGAW